jgi:zona occludens toxin
MALTLITGVPGTGKTAFLVSELEKIAATGRKIFVDNINSLKVPHYRAGKVSQWQAGTWLHIDQYIRTSPAIVAATKEDIEEDDSDGNQKLGT